ncbi:uncharacterized protein LOC108745256 [Agrilus planipennis]|uniref:Uncharacterized protein LOC108745256 n=1 Tax=Agrilus planipennis TaxID=224129 RepID=A0A7F5RNB6_AGRPL|nr:uncharacterized protein LOC108745256 [Agrilus planipennis]
MRWKNFAVILLVCVVVLLDSFNVEARKYGGRSKSRGSSNRRGTGSNRKQVTNTYKAPETASGAAGGGWSGWTIAKPNSQQTSSNTRVQQHKPSAPPDPNHSFIANEKKQQASSNSAPPHGGAQSPQKPIGFEQKNTEIDANKKVGWNVDSAKSQTPGSPGNQRPIGWNVNNAPSSPGSHGTTNQQHVSFVNQPNQPATKNTASNLNNPPPYSNGPPPPYQQYPSNTGYNAHPNGPPPPYSQYPTNTGYNQHYPNQGYNPQTGYNPNPGYNSHFGPSYSQPGYGNHYGGGFGGGPSFGGFGGGYNYGLAAYGKPKSSWGSTLSNVLAGAFIWHLVSGLVSKPYKVINYNNQAEAIPPKMELPPNLITTCPENITSLCAPNTFALCTTNQTIMCVASAAQTAPCGENANVSCISSTAEVPSGPPAPNKAPDVQNTTISVPCISNAKITGTLEGGNITSISVPSDIIKASKNGEVSLCVTTVAIPQTDEEIKAQEEAVKAAQASQTQAPCPAGQQPNETGNCIPIVGSTSSNLPSPVPTTAPS